MWDDFSSYLSALWGYARWILAGGPYFADAIVKRAFPKGAAYLDRFLKPNIRRILEITLIVGALFWASFLAWRDEHHSRLIAEGRLPINRHLTESEKAEIAKEFAGRNKDIPSIIVSSISEPEAVRYAHEFYTQLSALKFNTSLNVGAYSPNESDRGLMVGVANPDKPSDAAKLFITLMLQAGFRVKQIRYGEPGLPAPGEIDLFVGEKE